MFLNFQVTALLAVQRVMASSKIVNYMNNCFIKGVTVLADTGAGTDKLIEDVIKDMQDNTTVDKLKSLDSAVTGIGQDGFIISRKVGILVSAITLIIGGMALAIGGTGTRENTGKSKIIHAIGAAIIVGGAISIVSFSTGLGQGIFATGE